MNVEVFSYSVLASILGVAIVFTSLTLLSLLMVALKAVFGEREKKGDAGVSAGIPAAAAPAGAVSAVRREDNGWVMAAVAAFLAGEDSSAPSAEGWKPGASERSDPWMNRAAFDKKLG